MEKELILIPSEIKNGNEGGYVTTSDLIYDPNLGKSQDEINQGIGGSVKDKVYEEGSGTGMGRVTIKKDEDLASQFSYTNTVYIISEDFTLNNSRITIPAHCILKFDGGTVDNGILVGNNTIIEAGLVRIFGDNLTLEGTWNVVEAYPEWFGAGTGDIIGYDAAGTALTDDTIAIQKTTNVFDYVKLTGLYTISTVTIPRYHTIENSTTYVLDKNANTPANGYKMMMKSTLTGGLIEVNTRLKYCVDSLNHTLVLPGNTTLHQATVSLSGQFMEIDPSTNSTLAKNATRDPINYYYTEVTIPYGQILKVTNKYDSYGYLFHKEGTVTNPNNETVPNWVMNRDGVFTGKSGGTTVRIAKRADYWGNGVLTYDLVTQYSSVQGDFQDYDTFIKNRTAAITIADDNNNRRIVVSGIQIYAGDIYDSADKNTRKLIAGGGKANYIAAGIKTEIPNVNTNWNSFHMFTDVDIYGLFYGIVGNIRGSRFNITMEQCYDNIDIYGDLNIFDLNGQTGVVLNLNPNDTLNPIRPYDYFIYIKGGSNIINDGIYDIESKPRNHLYLLKEVGGCNVINSRLINNYNNVIANKTNGDFRAGNKYTWVGTHKHDFSLKGLKYTATLENSTYNKDINTIDLFDTPVWIDLLPTGTYNESTKKYSNTMKLTITIPDIYEPYGVTTFAQSNGYCFNKMSVYQVYTDSNNNLVEKLVAVISKGSTPYLAWNPDYYSTREATVKTLKLVFEGDEDVRWFGMRVYGKTTQKLGYGTERPTKGLTVGQQYFDTNLAPNRPVWWDGSKWSDLVSVVTLPVALYIDYKAGNNSTNSGVTVNSFLDGKFTSTGTATSNGGRLVPLSNVFTLLPGTYTLTREVLSGSVEGMMPYIVDYDDLEHNINNFNAGSKTITLTETKHCFIGFNFEAGRTYNCTVKLKVAQYDTFSLESVISDLLLRVTQLEH